MAAVPAAPEPNDWLAAAIDELKQGDKATLALLQESYRNINKILQGLPNQPDAAFGDLVYRAQLERTRKALLDEQAKLFDRLGDKVAARRLRSASRAAKLSAASDAALLRLVGDGAEGERLYAGATITAQRTVETILARQGMSKVPLSERIYNTSVWMHKRLDTLIASTLARGLNAQRFAKVARDWFSPSVPGGTRYAAMRLARTEINNAFHATSIDYAKSKPWVSQMDWHLSKSHPAPDKCNPIAAASPYDVHLVPRKPHPQCMCYVTERTPDEDEWIDRFVAGEFDDYLDSELAKADAQLGIKPTKATQSAPKPTRAPSAAPTVDVPKESQETAAPSVLTGDAAHGAVPKGLFKRGTLTPKQRKAAKDWESGWFRVINNFLREQRKPESNEDHRTAETVAQLDSAYAESRLTAPIQTWRGMHLADKLFGDLDRDLSGFAWQELGYSSTTTEERITDLFMVTSETAQDRFKGKNVKIKVLVDAGVGALQISEKSKGGNEINGPQAEIALERGLKWEVVADHGVDKNGIRQLDVRVSRISGETERTRPDGGTAGRELQASDPLGAKKSEGTSPEEFDRRVASAATDDEALAASGWGLGRSAQPAAFTTQFKTGISRYTGSLYRGLNALARGQQLSEQDEPLRERILQTEKWIKDAFAAVPGSSREVLVYRGIRNASVMFDEHLDGDMTGLEWLEQANTSTTAVEARTKLFLGRGNERVLMRILVPSGSKTIQGSARNAEAEVLIDRNSRFRVVRDNGTSPDGIRLLDVELIPTK